MSADDTAAGTSPPSALPSPNQINILDALFSSRLDKRLAHLQRLLSTTSGIDSTLCLVGYTLTLVSTQLKSRLDHQLRRFALSVARNASKTLLPGETVIATLPAPAFTAQLAAWQGAASALAGMCSDVRAFMRLWSLLGIWAWARRTYHNGPSDGVLKTVAWGQIGVNALFLVCEHPAYLAGKKVLQGLSAERQRRLWVWSGRMFAAHVALEFVRLWRVREMREERKQLVGGAGEKEDKIVGGKEEEAWWREALVNMAYSPMVLHWSLPGGFISETWMGLFGTAVGVMNFRRAWSLTA